MFHVVAHTVRGRLAIRSWEEGCALWRALGRHVRRPAAVCLMPDHVHVLHRNDIRRQVMRGLADFAQWRNHRSGASGPLWTPAPEPDSVLSPVKIRRSVRYIPLNPCRARIVRDPLLWPFSTHFDACGLAVRPVRPPVSDPVSFHRHVSADPAVAVTGTDFPFPPGGHVDLQTLACAVAAVARQPVHALFEAGTCTRGLFLGAAIGLAQEPKRVVARFAGVRRATVVRARPLAPPVLDCIARVAAIPGLAAMVSEDVPRLYRGTRYAERLV